MSRIVTYSHTYGDGPTAIVWVQEHLKGKHKEHCLCFQNCKHFHPGEIDNCRVAEENYQMCVKHSMVLPVWECPYYEDKDE